MLQFVQSSYTQTRIIQLIWHVTTKIQFIWFMRGNLAFRQQGSEMFCVNWTMEIINPDKFTNWLMHHLGNWYSNYLEYVWLHCPSTFIGLRIFLVQSLPHITNKWVNAFSSRASAVISYSHTSTYIQHDQKLSSSLLSTKKGQLSCYCTL